VRRLLICLPWKMRQLRSFDLDPADDMTFEDEDSPSLIAVEGDKLKDRLDALIEDVKSETKAADTSDWPESLITAEPSDDKVVPFRKSESETVPSVNITTNEVDADDVDMVIDNLAEDDALRVRTEDSASRFIALDVVEETGSKSSIIPYIFMMIVGSTLFGGGIAAWLKSQGAMFGSYGPLLTMCGIFIGAMMLLGALYYAAKQSFKGK